MTWIKQTTTSETEKVVLLDIKQMLKYRED